MLGELESKRMELAKSTRVETNCIGTILYVLGIIDNDTYVGIGEDRWNSGIVNELLVKMKKVDKPQEGALLVIRERRVEHLGLVVSAEPVSIYHRPGINAEIKTNDSLNDVLSRYANYPIKEFYIKTST